MKRNLMAAIAAATLLAIPASANTLTYNLSASVGSACGVYNAAGTTIPVAFGDLSTTLTTTTLNVGAGSASYRCNSTAGFTRQITSANAGKLVRTGSTGDANNSIAFTMAHGGGSGLGFAATSLATALSTPFTASAAFLTGQTGGVSFQINGVATPDNSGINGAPGTTVFAGDYTDVVTIAVTAN